MSAFIYFVLAIVFLTVGYFLGNIVGYLNGKAEVSHIMRGEPPDMDNELEHFKAFRADIAER